MSTLKKKHGGFSKYERIDIRLESLDARYRLEEFLAKTPPSHVAGQDVKEVIRKDGLKLRLGSCHWVMLRFSGTEPLLRIYCEAPGQKELDNALYWARELTEKI